MPRLFWGLLALTLGVYLVMVGWSLPKIAGMAGGLAPFDMRPLGYGAAEARAFLAALGDEGRGFYLDVQQRLDMAYPGLLAMVLVWALARLYRGLPALALQALAVLGSAADYLENHAVAALLRQGTAASDAMIAAASRWTVLKSGADTLVFAAILIGLAAAWRRRGRRG